jgi:hypothetical protein
MIGMSAASNQWAQPAPSSVHDTRTGARRPRYKRHALAFHGTDFDLNANNGRSSSRCIIPEVRRLLRLFRKQRWRTTMTDVDTSKLSWDEWDELHNPPPAETEFDRVVESALSRRGFLGGVLAIGSAAAAMGTLGNLMSSTSAQAQQAASAGRFAFKPIPVFTDNTIHVPEGYSWKPLAKWGQPLFKGVPDVDPVKGVSLKNSDKVFGENTDGMELFVVGDHQLIAVNHEYVNPEINLPHRE